MVKLCRLEKKKLSSSLSLFFQCNLWPLFYIRNFFLYYTEEVTRLVKNMKDFAL